MSYLIAINEHQKSRDYIEYVLILKDLGTGETWSLKRRYSLLRKLYESLPRYQKRAEFPPKKYFNNKSSQFIDQRRRELELYYTELLKNPEVYQVPVFIEFIKPKDREILSYGTQTAGKSMQKEPEMSFLSSAYARLTEETNSKFIDLGVKPNFISEDDALKRAEIYENLHMSPGSGFEPNLPDGHEINRTQINKPLRESRLLLEKSFLELTYAINEPIQVESFISTYI